ncbi:MAG TPA: hypothetical protein VFV67_21510 [Actinophytocola sp.]|uniref:hypothetical protein n=1 Tax=Actinophytocola sp. TaxID=1872138 RepID=UPI002DBB0D95|nr:hypothetical protein [Actinophytocola sp.]HEU5473230.1 hypothetical protein [Actinophytocola sp.]
MRRLFGVLFVLVGGILMVTPPAQADPVGPLVYGCPGFPPVSGKDGGVCIYEPPPAGMGPRYGAFHSYRRAYGRFYLSYTVNFVDVNSTTCGVRFYEVTYPYPGGESHTYLFTVYNSTQNTDGGYLVPSQYRNRVDMGDWTC